MSEADHNKHRLKRLPEEYYTGIACIHWTQTIRDRQTGWLSPVFFYKFQELLTHTMFRYALCCPLFCLMPDHMHWVWLGISERSNQLSAVKFFRKHVEAALGAIGYHLQRQPYDHILKDEERRETAFREICEYIARNPERAQLISVDSFASYKYSGCMIPGYPELRPFDADYWERFERVYAYLQRTDLFQNPAG